MQAKFSHENLPEHEKLVQCPYNNAHLVVQHRMAIHIIKCRKSHGTVGTKECRFNSAHIYPMPEIAYHEASCPDRLLIESFVISRTNAKVEKDEPKSEICTDPMIHGNRIKSGSSVKSESIKKEKFEDDDDSSDWDNISVATYKPIRRKYFKST